jgi:hypothetical protein
MFEIGPCYLDINQNALVVVYNWPFKSIYGRAARIIYGSDFRLINFVPLLTFASAGYGCDVLRLRIGGIL